MMRDVATFSWGRARPCIAVAIHSVVARRGDHHGVVVWLCRICCWRMPGTAMSTSLLQRCTIPTCYSPASVTVLSPPSTCGVLDTMPLVRNLLQRFFPLPVSRLVLVHWQTQSTAHNHSASSWLGRHFVCASMASFVVETLAGLAKISRRHIPARLPSSFSVSLFRRRPYGTSPVLSSPWICYTPPSPSSSSSPPHRLLVSPPPFCGSPPILPILSSRRIPLPLIPSLMPNFVPPECVHHDGAEASSRWARKSQPSQVRRIQSKYSASHRCIAYLPISCSFRCHVLCLRDSVAPSSTRTFAVGPDFACMQVNLAPHTPNFPLTLPACHPSPSQPPPACSPHKTPRIRGNYRKLKLGFGRFAFSGFCSHAILPANSARRAQAIGRRRGGSESGDRHIYTRVMSYAPRT